VFSQKYSRQELIEKMYDSNVNFYDVCDYAENYFVENGREVKGSGWKPFQRWKAENEKLFYPSGDRHNIDYSKTVSNFNLLKQEEESSRVPFANGWEELGPVQPGTITGHYAFGMGRIVSFYINPSNTDIMYLGSRTGGFWKTIDGGLNWTGGATDFLPASGVNTIAVQPTNLNNVLINVNNSSNHYSHGVYRSADGGDTFNQSLFNPSNLGWGGLGSNREIYKIKYHPTIPNLVFIGTRVGLYRSTDDLTTTNWTVPVAGDDFTDIDFHPTNPNIVYAYAKNNPDQIYISNDAGINFNTIIAIPNNLGSRGTIQVSPDCPDCVYFFSESGFWKSNDSGATFVLVSNSGLSDSGFAVSDLDDTKILAGYVDAFFSNDGGNTFNQVTYWSLGNTNGDHTSHSDSYNTSTDYIHADLQAAECMNGVFYACTDGFLVKSSDNGVSWDKLSENGIGIRMNYNLGVSQSNHDRTICGSQDNGTSIQTENGWVEMYGADGMEGIIHPLNDDWMIGSIQFAKRVRTKDAGQSSQIVTPTGISGYWAGPMFYDPNDQMTVYHFDDKVRKSLDFGDTWIELGTPTFVTNDTEDIMYATIAENNSQNIIVTRYENIELSTNGGLTFTSIRGTLPNLSITDVVFDPNDDNTIIVTYSSVWNDGNKIFKSTNQGSTWTNITHNLGNMPIYSVVIDHTNASNIYLGAEIGIYQMPMNGTSWSLYNTDLPNVSVSELEIMYGSNTLKASTWGRGLWEFALKDREDYPSIVKTDLSHNPSDFNPKEGIDEFVTSEILYSGTLNSVNLKWSINSPIFDNTIIMNNTSGNLWKSNIPIPNYPEGTKIYFKVVAEGSASDITETYKFMYTVKAPGFCAANGESVNGNLYLDNVTIGNINNTSTNDSYTYNSGQIINLVAGQTYTINLSANTGWGSNDLGAWIDFDNDTDFEPSELIITAENIGGSASASFAVPLDSELIENVRMRVRLGYWDSPVFDSCGETLGEVEDYLVNISENTLSNNNEVTIENFKVYPNPTSDKLTINLGNSYKNATITLSNVLGQTILTKKISNANETSLDIIGNDGIYFLEVQFPDAVKKVVKIIKK